MKLCLIDFIINGKNMKEYVIWFKIWDINIIVISNSVEELFGIG